MSEPNKRGAPSPVDCGGGKKVKAVAQMMKNEQELRQEGQENEREEGEVGAEDGALAAPPPQIDTRIDVALFHCKSCCRPLKPPLFECEAEGHVVCCRHMHGELCSRTEASRPALNAIIAATKVPCVYRELGCGLHIVYHDAGVVDLPSVDNNMGPMMTSPVRSGALAGGAPTPWQGQAGQGMYLEVPGELMLPDGTLAVSLQIDQL